MDHFEINYFEDFKKIKKILPNKDIYSNKHLADLDFNLINISENFKVDRNFTYIFFNVDEDLNLKIKKLFQNNPCKLFIQKKIIKKVVLVSPQKSGTHLMKLILNECGYPMSGKLRENSIKKGLYSVYTNSFHTSFRDATNYFSNFHFKGGVEIPFSDAVGILLLRHPLDIAFSRMNYDYVNNNTFRSHSRLKSLTDKKNFYLNEFIFSDLIDELNDFTNWLTLKNFIPICYEELVVSEDYNKDKIIINLWNIFLKVGISCKPEDLININEKENTTFYKGKINQGIIELKNTFLPFKNDNLLNKYLNLLGYEFENPIPKKVSKLRFELSYDLINNDINEKQLNFELNYKNYNIIYIKKKYYAVKEGKLNIPFHLFNNKYISKILLQSDFEDEVKYKILSNSLLNRLLYKFINWYFLKDNDK